MPGVGQSASVGRLLLLGGGNMGGAMLRGWIADGLDPASVIVVDPRPSEALAPLFEKGVRHAAAIPAEPQDIVILAVKPQMMDEAVGPLRAAMTRDTLVISVAAGITVAFLEARLGRRPVVRAMPNTPALIGRGITGAYGNDLVGGTLRATTTALLKASGPVEWVHTEAEIDMITAVSGSGPAYVFLLAEALAEAGVAAGLEPALAMRLARHTVAGAGELMIRSEEEPAQLRRNVTSPKGTTEAALKVLSVDDGGLKELMRHAVAAAKRRAEELSRGEA
ncbi:pyrroline-5-carboxylate reductase [Aureimonas sp. AU12]|jgi:pyrroline-5-carboxylate reductase|uniref:pyrroline-5-carboxylate reductase n=1 Tax=Aureimonas sp. AU12 TaxID=1638161 RepID=UPI000781D74F|nr:pyrroline-5-carboxylate reductase [Aureimonas sp. AU12]